MALPSVTVIIPAYNAAKTIRACVSSVLAVDYEGERELIVVDDRSTDDTCDIVASFDCALIRMETNGGPALARNAGARAARGEILIFVDADTEMRCDTIREAVTALDEDGVGAVTGVYEPEPLNGGFFPRYYAYMKYHALASGGVTRINAFGAQCGAVRKEIFESAGGYAPIAWGVDIENEEFGRRLSQRTSIALCSAFRVGHHFPSLRKLLFVFTNRIYWWIQFRHQTKQDETVLMTRKLGYATAALPASILCAGLAGALPVPAIKQLLWAGAALGVFAFAFGYFGFWILCLRRRGLLFCAGAAVASALFSIVITGAAAWAYSSIGWLTVRGGHTPRVPALIGGA